MSEAPEHLKMMAYQVPTFPSPTGSPIKPQERRSPYSQNQ
jgi:hypothetical protein